MSANPHVELIARLRRTIPGVDGKGRVIPCLVNPDGPQAADALEAATPSEREGELQADVALWKREAENRSQGMIDLNLDRAAMGVEISQLREIVTRYGDKIAMANAPAYLQHAIDDAFALEQGEGK